MPDKTILIVDDDENLLNGLRRILRKEDFKVLTATGGEDGLTVLENNTVQIIISDYNMPGMTGTDFLSIVKERYPETVRMLLTGQMELGVAIEAINHGQVFRYLPKPVNDFELKATITQCFSYYFMRKEIEFLNKRTEEQNAELKRLNDELERINHAQSQTLDVSQEILQRLPVAVIGINPDLRILITNDAAKSAIPELKTLNNEMTISDALPGDIVETIATCISEKQSNYSTRFLFDGNIINVMIEPINYRDASKGCILAFDVQELTG